MKISDKSSLKTRWLGQHERIPYDLLLLADETVEAINQYIADSNIYVLESDAKVIAVYVLFTLNDHEVEIKNIAVALPHQGQGIGKFLLQDAANRAAEGGYKSLWIGTAETAVKQLALYQKAGFIIHSIKMNLFSINYPFPIIEEGIPLKHMVMLRKEIK